ncbi:MAG: 30S ribosome-binding factor RbfA [Ruminococcus sp.]|jgi:ribosome-binding factor A|nr:30S ribosome-binding factor RbfA [Ruminococcus sp.]
MSGFKNLRLSEDILREVSMMIRDDIKDARVHASMVSIVRVELSGDNSDCKIYISAVEGLDAAKTAVKGLTSATGMIRRELADRLHLKRAPDLKFIADNSIEYSAKLISEMEELEKLRKNEKQKSSDND